MGKVLVLDYKEPRQKFLAWFLADSGTPCIRVDSLDDARLAFQQHPAIVIVNSTAVTEDIAHAVTQLRSADDGNARIVVVHDGKHREGEALVPADLCTHGDCDIDNLLILIEAAMAEDMPEPGPC